MTIAELRRLNSRARLTSRDITSGYILADADTIARDLRALADAVQQYRTERTPSQPMKTADGPPYDAATATGMYDHDDTL